MILDKKRSGERTQVNNLNPKEYLQKYKCLDSEINRLLEEKQRWMELASRITPTYSGMPRSGGRDGGRVQNAVEKIDEWERKINERVDELVELREEIEGFVGRVEDSRQREVLLRRYIHGQKWEEIALDMHYSYMQVCRIHGQALRAVML